VVQDIGGGNYVMYAHLKTGSVKPKVGDKLTTGQPLGLLGNSGNSDAPHLHFQVMSTPEPLRSNGLPFVFDKFRLAGRLTSLDTLADNGGPAEFQHGVTAQDETYRVPLGLDVTSYPAR
jgi:murein DD-endopeptidase MepM/ murein hydrolase activator NlpD